MAGVLRGEVYLAALDPVRGHEQSGNRPVVILSHDLFNQASQTVVAMAITSKPQRAGYPLTWRVPRSALGREAWVKIAQIRTLSAERLGRRVGRLGEREVKQLVEGLTQLVG